MTSDYYSVIHELITNKINELFMKYTCKTPQTSIQWIIVHVFFARMSAVYQLYLSAFLIPLILSRGSNNNCSNDFDKFGCNISYRLIAFCKWVSTSNVAKTINSTNNQFSTFEREQRKKSGDASSLEKSVTEPSIRFKKRNKQTNGSESEVWFLFILTEVQRKVYSIDSTYFAYQNW